MYKQIIIARKDLGMSPGKLAVQVSHASSAFLMEAIRNGMGRESFLRNGRPSYDVAFRFDKAVLDQWINGIYTKILLEAKDKKDLMKAKFMAEKMGLEENEDFFLVRDCCLTELVPEDADSYGNEFTVTAIGFIPMREEDIKPISKKFQLYKG